MDITPPSAGSVTENIISQGVATTPLVAPPSEGVVSDQTLSQLEGAVNDTPAPPATPPPFADSGDEQPTVAVAPPAVEPPAPVQAPGAAPVTTSVEAVAPSDLDDVKKKALHALAPIAAKLNIPAEERFKTVMQLIQATDNHELTQAAFDAAQAIESDADRAQALLDVVNEIEYLEKSDKKEKKA